MGELEKTNHAGIYRKGNRYQVRYRHHAKQVTKSFRTLSEARRFKGAVDKGDAQSSASTPFSTYAPEWLSTYKGRTSRTLLRAPCPGTRTRSIGSPSPTSAQRR